MEKFSKLKKHGERIDFIINNNTYSEVFFSCFFRSKPWKDDNVARVYREEAKSEMADNELLKAHCGYTFAIVHSASAKSLALSYASRASVLIKMELYEDAVRDIDRSLKAGCKEKEKLMAGRKLCEGKPPVEKLKTPEIPLNDKHPSIKHARNCIETTNSEKFGRMIIASTDIEIGEVLVVEPASFICVSDAKFKYCAECASKCMSLIPCNYCCETMYCNEECRKSAQTYHKYECLVHHFFTETLDTNKEKLSKGILKLSLKCVIEENRCKEVQNLSSTLEKWDNKQLYLYTEFVANIFLSVKYHTPFFVDFENVEEKFKELLMQSMGVITTNSSGLVGSTGCALYPLYSLFNHSCCPNVIFTSHRNIMVMRALRSIKKGDQCFISYINYLPFAEASSKKRRRELRERYYFECTCKACSENWTVNKYVQKSRKYKSLKNKVEIGRNLEGILPEICEEMAKLEASEPSAEFTAFEDLLTICYQKLAGKGREEYLITLT